MKQKTAESLEPRSDSMTVMIFLCVFLSGLFIGGDASGISTTGPHGFKVDECANCHVSIPADGQKGPFQMIAPVSVLCRKCHRSAMKSFSHPVDFKPDSSKVPPEFPLSYDGKFTCSTCHDVHLDMSASSGLRAYFLRSRIGVGDLCGKCHDKKEVSHETLLTAHMSRKKEVAGDPLIDGLSLQCLSCHNGVGAGKVNTGLPICSCPEEQTSHPIGMDYEMSRAKSGNLKPLDKTIRLFNGKMGCGTCHDPYSKNSKQLVVPNTGSALCLKCHIDY